MKGHGKSPSFVFKYARAIKSSERKKGTVWNPNTIDTPFGSRWAKPTRYHDHDGVFSPDVMICLNLAPANFELLCPSSGLLWIGMHTSNSPITEKRTMHGPRSLNIQEYTLGDRGKHSAIGSRGEGPQAAPASTIEGQTGQPREAPRPGETEPTIFGVPGLACPRGLTTWI